MSDPKFFRAYDTQLTVIEFLNYLQEIVKKEPTMKTAVISHVEMGMIAPSFTLYVTHTEEGTPTVVISGQ